MLFTVFFVRFVGPLEDYFHLRYREMSSVGSRFFKCKQVKMSSLQYMCSEQQTIIWVWKRTCSGSQLGRTGAMEREGFDLT